ncbi:MAG: toll/interleukin-1 receptor domain-containing protein [Acidobacteriota bacterium]|nr:toll/interleukin-1 receptor domain-containing protein [Acidobacteriota bacterium]
MFISYARKDGEEFARKLYERMEHEQPEISLWQDRTKLEGGVGWWSQISELSMWSNSWYLS